MSTLWDKLDPGFFAPVWLLVGFVAIIAVLLLELGAWRHRNQAVRRFAASHLMRELTASFSPGKRLVKGVLLILATGLLFIALARPHLLFRWSEESRNGFDLLFAVDCSKSMLSEDVKPNRLGRAKLAIADFADHLPDNRLGLIAFAGDAFLQCPLTIDHDAFQTAVRELDTDTIPRPGTDIATAIEQAVLALKSQPNNLKFLILVTDGEDLEGRVLDAAKAAAQSGLKIYTVGVGTTAGELIPMRDDAGEIAYLHDSNGQIVQTKLDESTLRQIASITGGAYEPLGQRGEGLETIYQRYIAPLPRQHLEERREKIRFERFEWPLGLGLLLLVWEFLLTERARTGATPAIPNGAARTSLRRKNGKPSPTPATATSALVLGLLLVPLTGNVRAATIDSAQNDYKKGQYEEAAQNYQKAVEKQPNRQDLEYNLGSADYKAGEFSEAEDAFHKALDTPDLKLQENSYYNLGNAQFKHGESVQKTDNKQTMQLWQQALNSYDSALKLNKTADAQHNYDLVKKRLEQLKQQQQQQQQNKNDSKSDKNESKDSQSSQDQGQQGQQPKDQDQQGKDGSQNQNKDQGDKPQQSDKQGQQSKDQQSQAKDGDKKDQNGSQQQQQASSSQKKDSTQNAHSEVRAEDKVDPGAKSRQEAENLLDSLKDDERHVTARTLNGNNEPPPPPASGKDW